MVSDSRSLNGDDKNVPVSYTSEFEKCLPYYLSIGMSWDQFWHGDPEIARYYREAHELKIRERNFELWLQGLYVYEAIGDMVPVLHMSSGKGSKPRPYSADPHPITKKMMKERDERENRSKAERVKSNVMAWIKGMQGKFSGKEEIKDAGEYN